MDIYNLIEEQQYLEQYVDLRNQYATDLLTTKVNLESTKKWLNYSNVIVLVIVKNNIFMGSIVLYKDRDNEVAIFVKEKGKGYGSLLLGALIDLIKKTETKIRAIIDKNNTASQKFFDSQGFSKTKSVYKTNNNKSIDCMIYIKNLHKSIAVLQPSYIPWLGCFEQISSVDDFILLDDVQYTKNDWRNRNKIKTKDGWQWLTVPVHSSINKLIKDIEIDNKTKWNKKHLKALEINYKKAKYYDEVYSMCRSVLTKDWDFLIDLNFEFIDKINTYLGIKTKIHRASTFNLKGDKNERLINMCHKYEAGVYYTGSAATDYLDMTLFKENNILVKIQNYTHPEYNQLYGNFIAYMSIIDLMFNEGVNSSNIVSGTG